MKACTISRYFKRHQIEVDWFIVSRRACRMFPELEVAVYSTADGGYPAGRS